MQKLLLAAMAAGTALAAVAPAHAEGGCGPGGHRGYYGHCRPNGGPVVVGPGPGTYVVDRYYAGRGYWDGRSWYQHRRHWHGGWRYY